MSKISKLCKKEKREFNRQLDRFVQEQINEFIFGPNATDTEILKFDLEQKIQHDLDKRGYLDMMWYLEEDDGWEDIIEMVEDFSDYLPYYAEDEDYRDDETYYDSVYGLNGCIVGQYYKTMDNQTLLCAFVGARKILINVHTGREDNRYSELDLRLSKIG